MIRIVSATVDDVDEIIKVQRETWIFTYSGKGNITLSDIEAIDFQANAPSMKDEIANDPSRKYWVAKDGDNRVVGYGYAIKDPSRHEIKSLYVLPRSHGMGIGLCLWTR
jgi:hypothetical protein